jgi:hypothetical protein
LDRFLGKLKIIFYLWFHLRFRGYDGTKLDQLKE